MKKNVLKIITLLMISLGVFTLGFDTVYAFNPTDGIKPETSDASGKIQNAGNKVIGIVQVVGTAIAVVMLIWLGIKYVSAAPDEKANIKQSSVIYIIGAVFLFAAVNIVKIIYQFSNDITK